MACRTVLFRMTLGDLQDSLISLSRAANSLWPLSTTRDLITIAAVNPELEATSLPRHEYTPGPCM